MVLFAVILRACSQHAVVLTYTDPWAKVLVLLGYGPYPRFSLALRFDDVLRVPIRARQPRSTICSHLVDFGRAPFAIFT
eukprot:11221319-Lingulodinium_polyedra.AAC.1